jgi:GAF domain-containing protein
VGIFLVDEAQQWAVLRAGSWTAGQSMLAAGHRLQVGGNSMIGSCVADQTARVAFDVGEEAVRFENPLLPLTRSEIAMPLLSRGQAIGAMSIQSTHAAAFTPEDITVLQTMADQLANAIENARLFQSAQQTVQQLEAAYGRYTLESWGSFARFRGLSGYRYRGLGVEPAEGRHPEAEDAWRQGRSVVSTLPAQVEGRPAVQALAVPIKLRNQVIGVLNLRSENTTISREVVGLVEEVANRLALSLENARLLEESRRRVAREQTLNAVTERLAQSLDIDTMLQTAVRELGQLPRVAEVSVHMGTPVSDRSGREDEEAR